MNGLTYLGGVVTLQLDHDKCTGCRMCLIVCPHEVFDFRDKKAFIRAKDLCMECGACQRNCPEGAIQVTSGVGCAAGILKGLINGTEPNCDCSGPNSSCC